jgi:hypothetical protein
MLLHGNRKMSAIGPKRTSACALHKVRWRTPLWWFTGAADPSNRKITLAIYDHGITIPISLPRKWSRNSQHREFGVGLLDERTGQ